MTVPESLFKGKIMQHIHDNPLGGHLGYLRTYQSAKRDFYWKVMKKDIKRLVRECDMCQIVKHKIVALASLLQPLPIPTQAWTDILMDFIEGLPRAHKYNVIMMVIDRFTKFDHFLPLSQPYTAASMAKLFMDNIFMLHGLPKSIVMNRDPIFMSSFWITLFSLQGTKLNHSSTYHPSLTDKLKF